MRGEKKDLACACEEENGGGSKAMLAASLNVLEAEESFGKEEAAREAATRHVGK